MRCQTHCPAPAATLRGPLLALGALAALALGVYVASLLGGVLVAAIVVVYATAIVSSVVWVRKYVRRPVPQADHAFVAVGWMRRCGYLTHAQADRCYLPRRAHALPAPQRILQNEKRPLALPSARPAVQGVVLAQDAESRLPA